MIGNEKTSPVVVDGADKQFRRQISGPEFVSSDSDVADNVADVVAAVADVADVVAFVIGSVVNCSNQW